MLADLNCPHARAQLHNKHTELMQIMCLLQCDQQSTHSRPCLAASVSPLTCQLSVQALFKTYLCTRVWVPCLDQLQDHVKFVLHHRQESCQLARSFAYHDTVQKALAALASSAHRIML
jgi:hypothetical protein